MNCGCISLPYMERWKDAGVLKDPGKRAFTDEEIRLNPAKADYAEMLNAPTMDSVLRNLNAGKGLPMFEDATTKGQARLLTKAIMQASSELDYPDEPTGLKAVRFKHGKYDSQAVAEKIYGRAYLSLLNLPAHNSCNQHLLELQKECDRLGLPRIRGVHMSAGRSAATMGDGVLAISKAMNQFFPNAEKLAALSAVTRPSEWSVGVDMAKRPSTSVEYFAFGEDRLKTVMWHEFGHHIHQQLGVKSLSDYNAPALEGKLKALFGKESVRPSKYADTNSKEWFAESYALFKMGRKDLIDPVLTDLLGKIEKGVPL